jgi:hypothetical protein
MTNEYKGTATADGIESSSIAFFGFGDLPSDLHPPDMIIIDDYGKALRANGK